MAPLTTLPTIGRKGIPLEKARVILTPVDKDWLPTTAFKRAIAKSEDLAEYLAIVAQIDKATLDELLKKHATQVILEWRKCARMVVATAGSNAKPGEQVDVLVQKPNIV